MENAPTPALIKWSALHGIAIVSLSSGQKVGTCDDFYFEPEGQKIYALRVKTGLMHHRILHTTDIQNIGQDAITIAKDELLISESDDKLLPAFITGNSLDAYKVMSEGGTIVGKVGNIIIDTAAPAVPIVVMFEMSGGLLERLGGRYATFSASQVSSYGRDVLVIPDAVAQQL